MAVWVGDQAEGLEEERSGEEVLVLLFVVVSESYEIGAVRRI